MKSQSVIKDAEWHEAIAKTSKDPLMAKYHAIMAQCLRDKADRIELAGFVA